MPEIRNPNLQSQGSGDGGGGGDTRSMLAFTLLALVVLLGYQFFIKPKPAPQPPAQQTQNQPQAQTPAAGPVQPGAASASAVQSAPTTPSVTAAAVTETTIDSDKYSIVFSNKGAQVRHWILKGVTDSTGKPLDMVQQQAAEKFGYPLSLFTYDPALNAQLSQALYQVTVTGAQPTATGHATVPATSAITFHYADNGLDVMKTVRFDSGYPVTVEAQVHRGAAPVRALVQWPGGLGDMEEFSTGRGRGLALARTPSQFAWSIDGKLEAAGPTASGFLFWQQPGVSNNATLEQPFDYAAITDLYFTAAFLPDVPARATAVTLHNSFDLPANPEEPGGQKTPAHVLGVAVGDTSGYTRVRLYVGPKSMDVLKTIHASGTDGKPTGTSIEPLIQYGWLTIIAKPLYLSLRFLKDLMGPGAYNWGWAIIIVTVLFNFALLPTRFMMMRSSLKMMRIQPKVEAIKRRFAHLKATDPKRSEMNTEMMALYKTEGVNMYGGCLPMLFQMPLFFAYYRVLYNAVELRHAHWFWLNDLASPDPLHILPILIIASMFLVQFITPSPGMDPNQRRMMAIMMPVIFGFSMWNFASGLALYWGTGNLINLSLQIAINRSSIGKEMHELAAKRAAKKAGVNPKTIQGRR